MIYICEMENGETFEAQSKKKLTENIINYFVENDCEVDQIKNIHCVFKDETVRNLCQDAINKIQNIIEKEVEQQKKYANENLKGQKEIEQDYYASLI